MKRATERKVYYPLYYIEPFAENAFALGFDLGSTEIRRNALSNAAKTGEATATEPVQLIQSKKSEKGFLVFLPVFENELYISKANKVLGFFAGVFTFNDLIKFSLNKTKFKQETNIIITDNKEKIFDSEKSLNTTFLLKKSYLQVGNRVWQLEFKAAVLSQEYQRYIALVIPISGILFTLFIAIFTFRVLTDNREELNAAYQAITEKNTDLQRSNSDLEQFAYIVSHDLQEPLRAMTGYLNIIAEKNNENELKILVSRAIRASGRMKDLIRDILLYSKIGRKTGEVESVDCNEIIQQVIENFQPIIDKNNIMVTFSLLPTIKAHKSEIIQIFQNLIGNAIKYRKEGAQVKIDIVCLLENNFWIFHVKDNGIGIAEEYNEVIFKIFKRLHNREDYPGTGIGLSICKKIIEQYNGNIWVKSTPGFGSDFCFTFPALNRGTSL